MPTLTSSTNPPPRMRHPAGTFFRSRARTGSRVTVAGMDEAGTGWVDAVHERIQPAATAGLDGWPLLAAVLAAVVLVGYTGSWRLLRVAVTLVHELGHALVGVLAGRRFTGFVVRGDMSGHAVTVGPARELGRVATTWAGYPAPALVGASMVWCAGRGWAASLLSAILAVLALTAIRIRSLGTAGVVLAAAASTGGLWWWRHDGVQALVVAALGVVLLLGAWRHLAAVVRMPRTDRTSDPAVLARLTGLPRPIWLLTFALALAAATWAAAASLATGG